MKDKPSRLAILVVYDKDGKIDKYLLYLMKELKENVRDLVVVCNGQLQDESVCKIKEYTQDIFFRKNEGYDAAAYKETLESILGWEKVHLYEELVLVNDSFYGPFCGLEEIFSKMESENSDFWGLTDQAQMINCFGSAYEGEILPYHIQSYFLVIKERMLKSDAFVEYWHTQKAIKCFSDAITLFELRFTEYFQKRGYVGDSYVKYNPEAVKKIENNYTYLMQTPYELVVNYECPIIKRKFFLQSYSDVLEIGMGEDSLDILQYVKEHTSYDVGMIWENLIRIMEPGQLSNAMHLKYVLPSDYVVTENEDFCTEKIAVIAHVNYPELINECMGYIKNIPKGIHIFITTKTLSNIKEIEKKIKQEDILNCQVVMIGDRGREIRGMLVECAKVFEQFEYICFVHDKRTTGNMANSKVGRSYMYLLWENMLKSPEYIRNVISLLCNNEFLGLLAPPPPYHWNYFGYLGSEWTTCYETTRELAERLELNCKMTKEWSPAALTTTFWCKSKALKALFEFGFTEEDFPEEPMPADGTLNHAIERIFSYVAQSEGFATGIILNDEYARLHMSNYHSMINGVLSVQRSVQTAVSYREYVMLSMDEQIKGFYARYKEIYIYGTGDYAQRVTRYMRLNQLEYKGYIVSDGHKKCNFFEEKQVITVSELLSDTKETGIIIALNKQNQKQVIPALLEKGYSNLCIM